MIAVKICGITNDEDLRVCVEAGAHALGFVVEYPLDVPWNLSVTQAADLVKNVPADTISCMVVGGSPREILALARDVRPDFVQLHSDETLAETALIARTLAREGIGVVKALRFAPGGRLLFDVADPVRAADLLAATEVAALLVDSGTAERPGGSGVAVDVRAYRLVAAASRLPVVLAGGLSAENLRSVVPGDMPPHAVDVLTGVESRPGRKDADKVRAFLRAARGPFGEKTVRGIGEAARALSSVRS